MNKTIYHDAVVRGFTLSALFWLLAGLVSGIWLSLELLYPGLNFAPWIAYGRLRVVHTASLTFGFGLGSIFATAYYLLQRLTRTTLALPRLATGHLLLFNVTIAAGIITLMGGMNTTKEYAEFEWPIDLLFLCFWLMFTVNLFATLIGRQERQMYVSLWYLIAMTVTIAPLYFVNNLAIPLTPFKSYGIYAGTVDADVQWWYGHNLIGFIYTMPILAMFYYFLPKSAGIPIYSHRLSIVAFWSLIFTYLWTGAHHLILTPLPEWIQTVAIAFSILLIAPSWGVVVNGYLTLRGNWEQMYSNHIVRYFIFGITFYGLQTIQGPLQGIRTANAFFHYTDWVIGHVHMGTMGWVTMVVSGSFLSMVPNISGKKLHSVRLADLQFWLMLTGQLILTISMWISGILQGSMLKAITPDGSLSYAFLDTMAALTPLYLLRAASGVIYFIGILLFCWNIIRTFTDKPEEGPPA
ncbi:MAG: cytochrome C oxidase Cbb3 [Chlorobiaceae bacterium]|nr:cytochrome C oxidase Cbb3 [Chlorobiaceae bacterium]